MVHRLCGFSFIRIYVFGWIIRLGLLCYGLWYDWNNSTSQVAFTDIDYYVLGDGAKCILYPDSGQGWNISESFRAGSPYDRTTFRYTPILAYLCTLDDIAGHLFQTPAQFPWFGKVIFVCCDMIVAWLMYKINDSNASKSGSETPDSSCHVDLDMLQIAWVLNPLVLTISTRGNAESFVCVWIMLWLFFLYSSDKDKSMSWNLLWSAISYGIAVHVKIFPILYILPLYLWMNNRSLNGYRRLWKPSGSFLFFSFASGSTFLGLGVIFYLIYGEPFINEAFLYHLTRLDHRHNFSIYFYYIYGLISSPDQASSISIAERLCTFLPQIVLIVTLSFRYYKDLSFACFLVTFTFVTLNKVCTSQYFIWYWMFVPLIWRRSGSYRGIYMPDLDGILLLLIWLGAQALWLSRAYQLEFRGRPVFSSLWVCSVLFLIANIWIIGRCCRCYRD
jgi:phosphatidylinositol glycan class M